MDKLVERHLEDLRRLCTKHRVRKLYLFGSATREDFDPGKSDLDFLVLFDESPRVGFDDDYFQLLRDMEKLFDQEIDLVEYRAIRNPYFKQEVLETRIPLYAA